MERKMESTKRFQLNPNAEIFQPRNPNIERGVLDQPEPLDLEAQMSPVPQPVQQQLREQLQQSLAQLQLQQAPLASLQQNNGQQQPMVHLLAVEPQEPINNDLQQPEQPLPMQQYLIFVYDQNSNWQQQHEEQQQLLQSITVDNNLQPHQLASSQLQQLEQHPQQQIPYNSLQQQLEKQLEYFGNHNSNNNCCEQCCNQEYYPQYIHTDELELYAEKLQSYNQHQQLQLQQQQQMQPEPNDDSEDDQCDGNNVQQHFELPQPFRQSCLDQVERNAMENNNQEQEQPFAQQQQPQPYLYTPIARAVVHPLPYVYQQPPDTYLQEQQQQQWPSQQEQQWPSQQQLLVASFLRSLQLPSNNLAQQQQPSIVYQQQQVPYSSQQHLFTCPLSQQQQLSNNVLQQEQQQPLQQQQQPFAYANTAPESIPNVYQPQPQPYNNFSQQQQQNREQQQQQPFDYATNTQQPTPVIYLQQQQQRVPQQEEQQQQQPFDYTTITQQPTPVIYLQQQQQQVFQEEQQQQQPFDYTTITQQPRAPMIYLQQQQLQMPQQVQQEQQPIHNTTITQQPTPTIYLQQVLQQEEQQQQQSPLHQQQQPFDYTTFSQQPTTPMIYLQQQQQQVPQEERQQQQPFDYTAIAQQPTPTIYQQQQQQMQLQQVPLQQHLANNVFQPQQQPRLTSTQPFVSSDWGQNVSNINQLDQQQDYQQQQLPNNAPSQLYVRCVDNNCQQCRDQRQRLASQQPQQSLARPWLSYQLPTTPIYNQLQPRLASPQPMEVLNHRQPIQLQDNFQQQQQANNVVYNPNLNPNPDSYYRNEPDPMVGSELPSSSITIDEVLCDILNIMKDHGGPITFANILEQLSHIFDSSFEIVRSLVPSAMYKATNRGYLHRVNGGFVLKCDPSAAEQELNSKPPTEQKPMKHYKKKK